MCMYIFYKHIAFYESFESFIPILLLFRSQECLIKPPKVKIERKKRNPVTRGSKTDFAKSSVITAPFGHAASLQCFNRDTEQQLSHAICLQIIITVYSLVWRGFFPDIYFYFNLLLPHCHRKNKLNMNAQNILLWYLSCRLLLV